MGIGTGMRGKDLQKFLMVARDMNVTILVRHTNEDSLKYVQVPGFYPKPAVVKAKTADMNPPADTRLVNGRRQTMVYEVSGLVVHPGFQPHCYKGAKVSKAVDCWVHTMETLSPSLMNTRAAFRLEGRVERHPGSRRQELIQGRGEQGCHATLCPEVAWYPCSPPSCRSSCLLLPG